MSKVKHETFTVRIVKLEPMRVASVWGFGESPEAIAWDKLHTWAGPNGLLGDLEKHRIFGFNNPNPSAGSPKYGYELWIEVGPEIDAEGDVRILEFQGGLYAVARCEVPSGKYEAIGETWQKLVTWREDTQYQYGSHQWLEQSVAVDQPEIEFALDLMMPIAE